MKGLPALPSAPNRPHAPAWPATDRPWNGGAQDGVNRAAHSEAGLEKAGARTRARISPPPPPPRRTDALAAGRGAPDAHGSPTTPTARVYPGGARRRQRMAGRHLTGQGGGERRSGPPSPPPPLPPRPAGRRSADPPPPRARGTPPLPQNPQAARPSAPRRLLPPAPAGVAGEGRACTSAPEWRADRARGRHAATNQSSMGAAPPMARASPVTPAMLPTPGGWREGFGLTGPPGERSTGRPPPPPPARQAARGARGGPATLTERARRWGMRRR